MQQDRRRHRRLPLRLSVACQKTGCSDDRVYRGCTLNVSTGGMLIELKGSVMDKGQLINIEVTVPPGAGILEFGGSFSSPAKVIRIYPETSRSLQEGLIRRLAIEFSQCPKFRV